MQYPFLFTAAKAALYQSMREANVIKSKLTLSDVRGRQKFAEKSRKKLQSEAEPFISR